MTLRARLLTTLVVGILIIVPLFGWLNYRVAERSVLTDTQGRLDAVREVLAASAENWFGSRRVALASLSDSTQTRSALAALSRDAELLMAEVAEASGGPPNEATWARVGGEVRAHFEKVFAPAMNASRGRVEGGVESWLPSDQTGLMLQYVYASAGRGSIEEMMLAAGSDPVKLATIKTAYARTVDRHQPVWQSFAARLGITDLALVARGGRVVWTLGKGTLLGQDLRSAKNRITSYGQIFAAAGHLDFSPSLPAERRVIISPLVLPEHDHDTPCYLMAAPVCDELGRRAGVLVARLDASDLNSLMTFQGGAARAGLGATGFAVLVGPDGRAWTQHRFADRLPAQQTRSLFDAAGRVLGRTTAGAWSLDQHPAIRVALDPLSPLSGTVTAPDDTGAESIWSYGPVSVAGLPVSLLVAQQTGEGLAVARALRNQTFVLTLAFVILAVGGGWYLVHRVASPIESLANAARRVSAGETQVRAEVSGRDEVADAATAFNAALDAVTAKEVELQELNAQLNAGVSHLAEVLNAAAQGDLTARAAIRAGPVAPVAALVNHALETMGTIVAAGQALSDVLIANAAGATSSLRSLQQEASQQAAQVQQAAEQIEATSTALANSARETQASLDEMETVNTAAAQGSDSMARVASGMGTVSKVVLVNLRRVQTAAETVTVAVGIVSRLKEIARRARENSVNAQLGSAAAGADSAEFVDMFDGFAAEIEDVEAKVSEQFENIVTEVGHAVAAVEAQLQNVTREQQTIVEAEAASGRIEMAAQSAMGRVRSVNEFHAQVEALFSRLRNMTLAVAAVSESTCAAADRTAGLFEQTSTGAEDLRRQIGNLRTVSPAVNGRRRTTNGAHSTNGATDHLPA